MADQSVVHRPTGVPPTGALTRDLSYLPPGPPPSNHGRTTAAWVTVTLVLIGSTVASVAVLFALVWLFWVGLAVVVLGTVVGKVLQILGHGQGGAATLAATSRSGH